MVLSVAVFHRLPWQKESCMNANLMVGRNLDELIGEPNDEYVEPLA